MTMRQNEGGQSRSIMSMVRTGMAVYDANGDHIGKVEDLYFGADADASLLDASGAATTGMARTTRGGGVLDDLLRAVFADDRLPETLRNRLMNEGFIQIEPGTLLGGDMFATPDQIAGVTTDGVRLSIERKQLIQE